MTLSFNEFYQYVFGTFSQIEINAQVPENKRKELFAKRKEAIQNKFKLITDNTDLSPRFRGLLRELNNQELEDHLYGNHTEQVEPTPFPQDEIILEHFESLDQQYGYFAQNKTAKERFITFFKACKLIADFDEMNNTEHDSLAYEHAYKILVLTDSKHILDVEKFFEKYSDRFKNGKPIHDILVLAIPKNDPPIHLAGWQ
ncbi:MAG: hypothetical protein LCH30_11545, partial [Proteobacteria bacterium]|nr:hypothetical protein [Pseudomonadota bacterium]